MPVFRSHVEEVTNEKLNPVYGQRSISLTFRLLMSTIIDAPHR